MQSQLAQRLTHLHSQFARGHQHQAVHPPRRLALLLQPLMQEGQGVGRRFTRAGLRAGLHIASCQYDGNGQTLDRRRRRIVLGLEGLEQFWAQAQAGKGHTVESELKGG